MCEPPVLNKVCEKERDFNACVERLQWRPDYRLQLAVTERVKNSYLLADTNEKETLSRN